MLACLLLEILILVHVGSDVRFALIGGRFVGEATLLRFYVLHCIGVPFIAVILMAVHFWRIRKDGGISRTSLINFARMLDIIKYIVNLLHEPTTKPLPC